MRWQVHKSRYLWCYWLRGRCRRQQRIDSYAGYSRHNPSRQRSGVARETPSDWGQFEIRNEAVGVECRQQGTHDGKGEFEKAVRWFARKLVKWGGVVMQEEKLGLERREELRKTREMEGRGRWRVQCRYQVDARYPPARTQRNAT